MYTLILVFIFNGSMWDVENISPLPYKTEEDCLAAQLALTTKLSAVGVIHEIDCQKTKQLISY